MYECFLICTVPVRSNDTASVHSLAIIICSSVSCIMISLVASLGDYKYVSCFRRPPRISPSPQQLILEPCTVLSIVCTQNAQIMLFPPLKAL